MRLNGHNKRQKLEPALYDLLRRGATVREAADVLGIHRSTAQRWLKRASEPKEAERPRQRNTSLWWHDENPERETIKERMRARLIEQGCSEKDADDPRQWLVCEVIDHPDPVLAKLQQELKAIPIYQPKKQNG